MSCEDQDIPKQLRSLYYPNQKNAQWFCCVCKQGHRKEAFKSKLVVSGPLLLAIRDFFKDRTIHNGAICKNKYNEYKNSVFRAKKRKFEQEVS